MLIELNGCNFGSFRDSFSLSLLATNIQQGDPRGLVEVPVNGEDKPLRLLRCAAIYGPNASGKSTVLRAAQTLAYLLHASASSPSDEPIVWYEPFLLDDQRSDEPCRLGVAAVIEGQIIEYSVEFLRTHFVSERLARIENGQEELLIDRNGQDVDGLWKSNKQYELIVDSFRPNALLLSLADTLAPSLARTIATSLRRLLRFHDNSWVNPIMWSEPTVAERVADDSGGFGAWLTQWLRMADVGIVDINSYQFPTDASPQEDSLRKVGRRPKKEPYWLIFSHKGVGGPVDLYPMRESIGTRKFVTLAPILHDLATGPAPQAYFVDEIGASLHSDLLSDVIRSFNCSLPANRVTGQLVFATHDTSILDDEARDAVLRRDQIYFVKKDESGASSLYSVAEFNERHNVNIRKRYLRGRYGALPATESLEL